MKVNNVDICCGLAWGDEAKGKLISELLKKNLDYVDGVVVLMLVIQYLLII